jgi:hypothetical protein
VYIIAHPLSTLSSYIARSTDRTMYYQLKTWTILHRTLRPGTSCFLSSHVQVPAVALLFSLLRVGPLLRIRDPRQPTLPRGFGGASQDQLAFLVFLREMAKASSENHFWRDGCSTAERSRKKKSIHKLTRRSRSLDLEIVPGGADAAAAR